MVVGTLIASGMIVVNADNNGVGNGVGRVNDDAGPFAADSWSSWGGDIHNTRNYVGSGSQKINVNNAKNLKQLMYMDAQSGVAATPTTTGDKYLYYTDASGLMVGRNRFTGAVLGSYNVTQFLVDRGYVFNGYNLLTSRSSPAIDGSYVYIGTLAGGYVLKIHRTKFTLKWASQVSDHPYALLTQSPRVYKNQLFIGTASNEEQAQAFIDLAGGSYTPSFVGTFNALNTDTGALQWSHPIVPANYTGGAVWGSEPPIDEKRQQIIIATGNSYTLPDEIEACRAANDYTTTEVTFPDVCRKAGDLTEALVAFDLETGDVRWSSSHSAVEAWTIACGINLPDLGFVLPREYFSAEACPNIPGPDIDYGMAPIYVPGKVGVTPLGRDVIVTGQKSGIVTVNNVNNGHIMWSHATGPGGAAGGLMFGSATDGKSYFYSQTNSEKVQYKLANGQNTTIGHVGSLRLLDGKVEWQYSLDCFLNGAVAHSNGLVYVPCGGIAGGPQGGQLHVFNAGTGERVFTKLSTPGNRINGVSIVDGKVYVPTGYTGDKKAGGIIALGV